MNEKPERSIEAEARRTMLANAVQHPGTLLPMASAIAALIYLLLLSPLFDGRTWVVVILAGASSVAALSFAWLYGFRHADKRAGILARLMDERIREESIAEKAATDQRRKDLHSALDAIGFHEGLEALDELAVEYELLQSTLGRQEQPASISMVSVPGLADGAYRRGLSVLEHALRLMQSARTTGRERLEAEIAALEMEVESASMDGLSGEGIEIKEATLASHRKRLEMIGRQRLHTARLVHQARRCEASLSRARIALAEIEAGSTEANVTAAVRALEGTVNQVREVQEELQRLGY
jgi:hypothetical protein